MIAITLIGMIAVTLLVVRHYRRSLKHRRDDDAIHYACCASNPPVAQFCRRCGERLTIDLCDETVPEKG